LECHDFAGVLNKTCKCGSSSGVTVSDGRHAGSGVRFVILSFGLC
jgi:hypothetical protein